jgi:hypothetical protein
MKNVPYMLPILITGLGHPLYTNGQNLGSDEEEVLAVMEKARQAVQNCLIAEYTSYRDEKATIFTTGGTELWPIAKYLEIWQGVCASGGGISFETGHPQI